MDLHLIIATASIALVAAVARLVQGSWLFPGPLFALYWLMQALLSLIDDQFRPWPGTLYWIAATSLLVAIANYFAGGRVEPMRRTVPRRVQVEWPIPLIVVGSVGSALFLILSELSGIELSIETPPPWIQILLTFNFLTPFVSGVFAASTRSRTQTALLLLPLVPPLALALASTGRLAFLVPVLYWVSGFLCAKIVEQGGRLIIKPTVFLGIVVGVVGAMLFASTVYEFRSARADGATIEDRARAYQGVLSADSIANTWRGVRSTVLGQIYSFNYYFTNEWTRPEPLGMGTVMFRGPLIALGYDVPRYPFEDFELDASEYSNTYTILRPPIADFGLLGSLAFWAAVGGVQGVAYRRARRGRLSWLIIMAWFYIELPLIGGLFFSYNVTLLANLLAGMYLLIAGRWSVDDGRRDVAASDSLKRRGQWANHSSASCGFGLR
jgi:hypothetical protein